jgi:hypothetical protein
LLVSACAGSEEGSLDDLQIVGIDYGLDSILLTNNGTEEVRTEGLWVYQNGQSDQFNIFTIEPRATIRFSVQDVGGTDPRGGEIALFSGDSFSDPEAMLDYVAWGAVGHDKTEVASDAALWGTGESIETADDTVLLLRTDPSGFGEVAWTPSSELP